MHKFRATILIDPCPDSPRLSENLGTMAFTSRGWLGDEVIPAYDSDGWFIKKAQYYIGPGEQDITTVSQAREVLNRVLIALPIYLYDHSGITISTTPFSCKWDSGLAGHIFVEKQKALNKFRWTKFTEERLQKVHQTLIEEVARLSQYLTGDVYSIRIDEVDELGNVVDEIETCGGYYGRDHAESEAKRMVDGLTREMQIKSKGMFCASQQLLVF